MEGWTLDEILDDGCEVIVSNSGFIITWHLGSDCLERWARGQGEDEYFEDGVRYRNNYNDVNIARAHAEAWALGN